MHFLPIREVLQRMRNWVIKDTELCVLLRKWNGGHGARIMRQKIGICTLETKRREQIEVTHRIYICFISQTSLTHQTGTYPSIRHGYIVYCMFYEIQSWWLSIEHGEHVLRLSQVTMFLARALFNININSVQQADDISLSTPLSSIQYAYIFVVPLLYWCVMMVALVLLPFLSSVAFTLHQHQHPIVCHVEMCVHAHLAQHHKDKALICKIVPQSYIFYGGNYSQI